jgi:uncharacterized protein
MPRRKEDHFPGARMDGCTNGGVSRLWWVILQKGDEAMRCLQDFAVKEGLGASQVTAIGALSSAKLAFFDWETKQYRPIPVEEQVEVASLVGDIAVGPDGKPSVHVHAVLGRRDGTALAGHLQEGHVRPTLEISSRSHRRIFARLRMRRAGWP